MDTYTRTLPLPLGFKVTFSWSEAGSLEAQWTPDVPCIRSPRHRRKFFAAYQAARRDFIRDVATSTGKSVLVADLAGSGDEIEFKTEIIRPAAKH